MPLESSSGPASPKRDVTLAAATRSRAAQAVSSVVPAPVAKIISSDYAAADALVAIAAVGLPDTPVLITRPCV